jgi:hypothetical protein
MKNMIRVAALCAVAVTALSSKTVVKDQPIPLCYPDCDLAAHTIAVPDQPIPLCYPDCDLAR